MIASKKLNLLCLGLLANATSLQANVPHVFEGGKPALASQVNENFKAIDITPPDIVSSEKTRDDGVLLIDLSISDDVELEKVIFSGGNSAVDSSLVILDNNGTYLVAPDVSDISVRTALRPSSENNRVIIHVTDMSGNSSKFWKTGPIATPSKIQSGTYQLEQPMSIPACISSQESQQVESLTINTNIDYDIGHGNFGASDLRVGFEAESESHDGGSSSSSSQDLPAGTFETCPAEPEQDYSSDSDYALVGPSSISIYVSASPITFSYQGSVADQAEYCSNVKYAGHSYSNGSETYKYVGGTIQPLADGSITVEFRTACKVGEEIEKNVFSATGQLVSQ